MIGLIALCALVIALGALIWRMGRGPTNEGLERDDTPVGIWGVPPILDDRDDIPPRV